MYIYIYRPLFFSISVGLAFQGYLTDKKTLNPLGPP